VFGYNALATDYRTGLQYLRARYYDTGVQRFVQEDDYRGDFTEPQTMNRYAYVHGNPVMGVDPSGYVTEEELEILLENVIIANSVLEDAEDAYADAESKWRAATLDWEAKDRAMDSYELAYNNAKNAYSAREKLNAFKKLRARIQTRQSLSDLKAIRDNAFSDYKYSILAERYAYQIQLSTYWKYIEANKALKSAETRLEIAEQKLGTGQISKGAVEYWNLEEEEADDIAAKAADAGIYECDFFYEDYSDLWWKIKSGDLISPLDKMPQNTEKDDYFNHRRDGGDRSHAGTDFEVAAGTPVYAMEAGNVIRMTNTGFYMGTGSISIRSADGTVIRYCEIDPLDSLKPLNQLTEGEFQVQQGDLIGYVKETNHVKAEDRTSMLHLEIYSGYGYEHWEQKKYTSKSVQFKQSNNDDYKYVTPEYDTFERREDLIDSTGALYLLP